jgi:hypothetical protein
MAAQLPLTRAELDAQKAGLIGGYGAAAGQVRGRAGEITGSYEAIRSAVARDAAARKAAGSKRAEAQARGMGAAAQDLGVAMPQGLDRAAGRRGRLLTNAEGDAGGWGQYLQGMGRFAVERNDAHAAAFDNAGQVAASDLERQFNQMLAMMAGGGGGGGGGGRGRRGRRGGGGGYEDEPLVEYPTKIPSMPEGVIRGYAMGTIPRLNAQASAFKKAGLSGPGSLRKYAARLAAARKK